VRHEEVEEDCITCRSVGRRPWLGPARKNQGPTPVRSSTRLPRGLQNAGQSRPAVKCGNHLPRMTGTMPESRCLHRFTPMAGRIMATGICGWPVDGMCERM